MSSVAPPVYQWFSVFSCPQIRWKTDWDWSLYPVKIRCYVQTQKLHIVVCVYVWGITMNHQEHHGVLPWSPVLIILLRKLMWHKSLTLLLVTAIVTQKNNHFFSLSAFWIYRKCWWIAVYDFISENFWAFIWFLDLIWDETWDGVRLVFSSFRCPGMAQRQRIQISEWGCSSGKNKYYKRKDSGV